MQGSFRGKSRAEEIRAYASTSETSAEDFLFHLYRGSELLQDDRVHQAKEELEAALRLQPRDPKGQDLLAVVYFRLGLYPRAIEIYEELVRVFPTDASLGNNLALCYLKTGQSEKARSILEQLVMHQPEHVRAWAYLGLAYERLGDYGKAKEAFLRGQASGMARRMAERLSDGSGDADFDLSEAGLPPSEGFEELVDPGVSLSIIPSPSVPPPASIPPATPPRLSLPPELLSPSLQALPKGAPNAGELAERLALTVPEGASLAATSEGVVIVRFAQSFATRLEALRAAVLDSGELGSEILLRRSEGEASDHALGGTIAPIVTLSGSGELVLGARGERRLVPIQLEDEALSLREDALIAFDDANLAYGSFELPGSEAGWSPMVELRGKGGLVLEVSREVATVRVDGSRSVILRRDALVGWLGQLAFQPLSPNEAPGRALGLLRFFGEGAIFLAPHTGGLLP